MDDFDFIKGFVDVDLLQVEAISRVIGRVTGVLFQAMTEVGVSDENSHRIIGTAITEVLKALHEVHD